MTGETMRAWELSEPTGPRALRLGEVPRPAPGIGQVLMRTTSIGVNRAELMATRGHYPMTLPATPGMEGGGEIVALGSAVTGWSVGDLVSPAHGAFLEKGRGSYAEYVVIDEEDLVGSPASVTPEHIGGLWLPYVTAYHGLVHLAGLREGQIVVVPAASSSVGLAAIFVARDLGARVVAYTSRAAKIDAIVAATGIERAHVIGADKESLHDGLRRILGKEAPDVFFDPIGGDFLEEELRALKQGGVIVIYGGLGGRGHILTGRIVMKAARVLGHYLGTLRRDRTLMRATYRTLVEKIDAGDYRITVARDFPFDEAPEALEFMARNEHVGKIHLCL